VQYVRKGHSRQKDEKTDSGDYLLSLCSECFVFPFGVYANSTRSRASPQYRRYRTRTCYGPSLCTVSVGLPLTEFYNGASMCIVVVACTSFGYQIRLHLRRCPITHDIYISIYLIYPSIYISTNPPINQAIKIPIYLSINLSTHPFIYLPIYTPTYPTPNQFTHLPTYRPIYPPTYLPKYPPTHLFINLTINPSTHRTIYLSISINLSIHQSINSSIHPPNYLSISIYIHPSIYLYVYIHEAQSFLKS